MRFLKDSPTIPDELLFARDEGRVVLFCGAGVSRARAGLSDFFGLADDVIRKLGVPTDHPARKILDEAREMEKRTGVSGLISADRVFGLLERDFLVRDIEAAVAHALQPPKDVDLSAHRILLNLATTPEGKVRLVTTNFDRLFEDCSENLRTWQPPRLPDPSRHSEMDGIVHLHGYATEDYSRAEGDGFVLSSSAFGRAYLSDGWATEFFREVLARYVVVFVGYTAEDPPVQYLLEALNNKANSPHGVYAFQAGLASEAIGKWLHKGVEAVPYAENDGHRALWETLSAWAERAKAPDEWFKSVLDLAKRGPEVLQPHERGQVVHIVSRVEGARGFAEAAPPPPAEWLCVFDPSRRYAPPGREGGSGTPGPFVDPFDCYGLDSDLVPDRTPPDAPYWKRDVAPGAWDGFSANEWDRQNLRHDSFSAMRGHWSTHLPRLPSRLDQLGVWLARIADQPASVWWAAHQPGLHPDIQERICFELQRSPKAVSPVIRQAWQYLFEAWGQKQSGFDHDWYQLKRTIDRGGWNSGVIRSYAAISRPYLKAESAYWSGPVSSKRADDIRIQDIVRLDVVYADPRHDASIPDEWLAFAVRDLRKNLEHAVQLETELGGYALHSISPILPDEVLPDVDHYGRTQGLSGSVILFASLFERLIGLDIRVAKHEFGAWPANADRVFDRLRIWASGNSDLAPSEAFGAIIAQVSDAAFWGTYDQRDLLLVLAKRWPDLPEQPRKEIENRLLQGPARWNREEDAEFEVRKAGESLNRLTWLANNGCNFTFDLRAETKRLQILAPRWKAEYARKAAESIEGRVGWVRTEGEHSALLNEPLRNVLAKALEQRRWAADSLVENDPFAGLSAEYPVLAFSALTNAAKRGEYPEWAWHTFLNAERTKKDKPRFSALIAERISRYPNQSVAGFIGPASDWLLSRSKYLSSGYSRTFDRILSKLIDVLRSQLPASTIRRNKEPDWTTEAINAPVGKLAEALFNDQRTNGLEVGRGFHAEWLIYVNDLLSLSGDLRRHALAIFAHNLNWFYTIDPSWTDANILSVLNSSDVSDRNAVWSGFLWGGKISNRELYMRLKPDLIAFAKQRSLTRRGYENVLPGLILAGWGRINEETGERWICNAEMHDVLLHADDQFRAQILWHVEVWSKTTEDGTGERWGARIPELLRDDVWPRQKSVKSPTISARLCDLAFSNAQRFPQIAEMILPLLTTIERNHFIPHDLLESKDSIVDRYPQQMLAILHAVLPDNVAAWPYGTGDILHRIGEADNSLRLDERLLELNRKWNSR